MPPLAPKPEPKPVDHKAEQRKLQKLLKALNNGSPNKKRKKSRSPPGKKGPTSIEKVLRRKNQQRSPSWSKQSPLGKVELTRCESADGDLGPVLQLSGMRGRQLVKSAVSQDRRSPNLLASKHLIGSSPQLLPSILP